MNEELTREVLEAIKKCSETHCNECLAVGVCCSEDDITIGQRLATALLAERAKPKVWDGAPERAERGIVNCFDKNGVFIDSNTFTREPPKTRTRQIIENPDCPFKSCQFWDDNADGKCGGELHGGSAQETCKWYTDYESALNKYAEELTKKETD